MAIRLKHSSAYSTYFCTFTCYNWLALFEITKSYDIVYKWFRYLREREIGEIIAYVIMPNHIHYIMYFKDEHFNLNKIVANAKRFMAYEIVERLKAKNEDTILNILAEAVTVRERNKGQLHKVFEESFDGKAIFSKKFLEQKLAYIHNNPVSGKWQLAKDFTEYEHSSASFYETASITHFKPVHFMDMR